MLTVTAIDHIGIATPSLEQGLKLYQGVIGLSLLLRETLHDQGVEIALLCCGDQTIELLAPTRADSAVAKFLGERGAGQHHVAYRVPNLREAIVQARAAGLALVDETPRIGAGGHLVAFLHPRDTGRVLIELVEKPEAS